jgi:hypothetical protein
MKYKKAKRILNAMSRLGTFEPLGDKEYWYGNRVILIYNDRGRAIFDVRQVGCLQFKRTGDLQQALKDAID